MKNTTCPQRLLKCLATTLTLSLCFVLAFAGNMPSLNEMPPPTRILYGIKGKDAIDTKAKQAATFYQLIAVMQKVQNAIGKPATSREKTLAMQYNNEASRLNNEVYKMAMLKRNPSLYTRFGNTVALYKSNSGLQKEIFDRFFSASFQNSYASLNTGNNFNNQLNNALSSANEEAKNNVMTSVMQWLPAALAIVGGIVVLWLVLKFVKRGKKDDKKKGFKNRPAKETNNRKWFLRKRIIIPVLLVAIYWFLPPLYKDNIWLLVFGITGGALTIIYWVLIFLAVRGIYRWNKKRKQGVSDKRTLEIEKLNKPDEDLWNSLGATYEEREKNIKKLFDKNDVQLGFGDRWDWGGQFLKFRISRNLAAMDAREREFLRTTYLLYNADLLNDSQLKYYRFAFIYGSGKAGIEEHDWWLADTLGIKDSTAMVKYYCDRIDGSVESAVNHMLQRLNNLEKETGVAPPVLKEIKGRIKGGGTWLTDEDLESTLFNDAGEYSVKLGTLDEEGTELTYAGEGSIITIAPPGSGKTQCFVIPNMLRWKGSAVILDVKGEIYDATSKWRAENVGPVYKFSPLDPANSHCYNPLFFIRQQPEFIWEDSRFLADMLIVPSGGNDPFWENMARDVLTAAVAYVCLHNAPEKRPMSKVMDILYGIGWDEMVLSLKTNVIVDAMRQTGYSLADMEKKTRDSVLKTAQSSMSAWQGERISKSTRKSDWSPMDLRHGKPTIYICINPNEIDSYLSILRVFIAQHIRMLTSELPARGASPVLFVLDELPRLKKMPPVDEALNIGRQYGIRLWMFAQSYGQLKDAYSNPEGMMGSCMVRTFMNIPLNDELAQKISDQLGYREGPLDTTRIKLVEPLELAGPNFKDIVLVLASNTKPAKVVKAFAWKDEEMKKKMGRVDLNKISQ